MKITRATGVEGARAAAGFVIVVDVLRAFTVSAFALAGGARECLLVRSVEEARRLAAAMPDAVVSAEVDTLPVDGVAISNSPTQITRHDLAARALIQRTSAGTQAIAAVGEVEAIYAASLVVATATARACLSRGAARVTLVASGDFPEDHACCSYMEAVLSGTTADLEQLLEPLFVSERYRKFAEGDWPGFPSTDLELALHPDRFRFAMPASRQEDHIRLVRAEIQD